MNGPAIDRRGRPAAVSPDRRRPLDERHDAARRLAGFEARRPAGSPAERSCSDRVERGHAHPPAAACRDPSRARATH
jgi:hypothetical protein